MHKYLLLPFILIINSCQSPAPNDKRTVEDLALEEFWHQQPLRILQTVLRQPDASNYDVDSLVQYMQHVFADVLVINGGGIVDYFQNSLPMANINPYIGERDLLAEIVQGCHEAGIKVIARVDFRGVDKERYDQHPDWFARDENGGPIVLNYTTPVLYAPCYNGFYRNEHAVRFISQLFEKYHIDGIWHNSVNFHSTCYCNHCEELYHEEYQQKIPITTSPNNEWEMYFRWNEKMASNHLTMMRATVKKYGEDKSYAAEVFDMYSVEQQKQTGINLYSAAEYFDFLVTVSFIADNSFPIDYKDIYYPSAIIRFLKSLEPNKPPVILFGGNGTEHRYIYDPPVDSRLWLWETAGTGGGFWNCYFNGSFPANTLDRRNAYVASDAYKYILDNQVLIQHLQPVTDVAVFYSKGTGQLLGDEDFAEPLKGTLRLLEEGHYQYGFVSDRNLSIEKLDQFKVLIMPNVAAISSENSDIIRKWVANGGRLIVTYMTSLFDENGIQRRDFALADVFGVSFGGSVVSTETDCYQKIIFRNEILQGFEQTKLLHNGGKTLMVNPNTKAKVITGYLPKINNQPPENAYPATWNSDNPIVVFNKFGNGKVVYFANEAARLNYTIGHPDYRDLLENAVEMLFGSDDVLQVEAPASVHVYLNKVMKHPGTYQLSLINTSSLSHRPLREIVPVSGIRIIFPFKMKKYDPLSKGVTKIRVEGNSLIIDDLGEFFSILLDG